MGSKINFKNFVLVTFLLFMFFGWSSQLFSKNKRSGSPLLVKRLIEQNLNKNYNLIQQESFYLTEGEKLMLFMFLKKDPGMSVLLNIFPGFGLGSLIQSDLFTAGMQMGGEFVSLLVASANMGVSIVVFLAARCFGVISSIIFNSTYNSKLAMAVYGQPPQLKINIPNKVEKKNSSQKSFNFGFDLKF